MNRKFIHRTRHTQFKSNAEHCKLHFKKKKKKLKDILKERKRKKKTQPNQKEMK